MLAGIFKVLNEPHDIHASRSASEAIGSRLDRPHRISVVKRPPIEVCTLIKSGRHSRSGSALTSRRSAIMLYSVGLASPRRATRRSPPPVYSSVHESIANEPVSADHTPPTSLRRNAAWMLVGNVTYAASQWGILIILARLGSPEMVGQYTLAVAMTAPVFMLAGLNLSNIQATDIRDRFTFGEYFALRLICLAVVTTAITSYVSMCTTSWDVVLIVLSVASIKAAEMVMECSHAALRRMEAFDLVSKSKAFKSIGSVFVFLVGFWTTGSLPIALLVVAVCWLGMLVVQDVPYLLHAQNQGVNSSTEDAKYANRTVLASLAPSWNWGSLKTMFWLSLPLGLGAVLNTLGASTPHYFIAYHGGDAMLGVFAPMACFSVAISLLVRSVAMSAMPRFARHHTSNRSAFRKVVLDAVATALVIGGAAFVAAWFLGEFLLLHLFGEAYAQQAAILPGMIVAGTLSAAAAVLSLVATSTGMYRTQLVVYTINLVLIGSLALTLIAHHGLWGAVYAIGIGAGFRIIVYTYLLFACQTWVISKVHTQE